MIAAVGCGGEWKYILLLRSRRIEEKERRFNKRLKERVFIV